MARVGAIEISCGILLIVPAVAKWMPVLTPLAAAVLALESLGLSALYARYSLALACQPSSLERYDGLDGGRHCIRALCADLNASLRAGSSRDAILPAEPST